MPATSKQAAAVADSVAISVHYVRVSKLIQTTISMLPLVTHYAQFTQKKISVQEGAAN